MVNERVQRQIDRLLDQAEEAMGQLDWEVVRRRSQAVLSLQSDNDVAQTYLEAAVKALGEPDVGVASITNLPSAKVIAEPASFAGGRYQVKEFIGEGGKKRVYRAHDSVLDRDVALAVIKNEGLDPTSRVRITREAQAMGRLGDHPHVLSIHDLGDEAGQPYMVLPLMPGGDVGTLLENAEDHRLPLDQAIDLAAQICRGLEFAHSKDIVHRDLKPGNIWLTTDGTARIGDFGLAVAIDRSRLTQEGMIVGTVSYMPPEQAMGGDVTPRSDLYSLGAMLYEMVCGRPPFLGDDSVAIISQHINTPPVAPRWHNSKCPRSLEALILRLLSKDPSERPESASDVLAALEGIDLEAAHESAEERGEAHLLDSLAGGVFVGRRREMGELKAALEDALSGRGRLLTLVGEQGIGKTRTAEELATYAGLRGAQVLWGRCYEERGMPPYWPWVQAIRSYVREKDPKELRSEMGSGAPDIAEVVSDVRERLPDLSYPPAPDSPEAARFRLFDSITAFLKSAAQSRPLLLVLDDLHWADLPSLQLLQFISREIGSARLVILGTYRDIGLTRQHPLAETLAELTRERLFERVLLRGLGSRDVGQFIELTSGVVPPQKLVEAVHTQTEGNPLFVTEVVRLLVQEGELSAERGADRESWSVRIPEGVREVIGRRLNRLSARCNETMTVAAVLGREFELSHLRLLIEDATEETVLQTLDEALGGRVIEELPQAVGRYRFTHALIRQTFADELSTTRRVRLHARIGKVLEELYGDEVEAHAAQLAYHYTEAESVLGTEKSVRYLRIAGERALANYAFEEAQAHFERALSAKEGQSVDAETATLLFGVGRAQSATAQGDQLREAWASLTQAFEYYVKNRDVAGAVAVAVHPIALEIGVEATASAHLITRALSLVAADSSDAGRLLSRLGLVLGLVAGDYMGAQQAFERSLAIAQQRHEPVLEMETLASTACVDWFHLRWAELAQKSLRAMNLALDVGEPVHEWGAHLWAVNVLGYTGELDDALRLGEALVSIAERLRHRNELALAYALNARVWSFKGEWATARSFIDRALELSPQQTQALVVRLLLELETGDYEACQEHLAQFAAIVNRTPPGPNLAYAYLAATTAMASWVTLVTDQFEAGRKATDIILSSSSPIPFVAMLARTGQALVAIQQEDGETAAQQYSALEPMGGALCLSICGDRLLGLLAQRMGKQEQAIAHFEDAVAFCSKAGYRPELAWSLCDYADILLERDDRGDRQKASTLLDESLTISSDLGMRPLTERVLFRKMNLQGIDVSSPQTSIDAVVSAIDFARPNLESHAAPDGTVTVMFTDIEGSTAMTERLGDEQAQNVLRIHNAIIREQVAAHDGFEVKSQGDGFMLAFSSARRALECAVAIQQTLATHNAENSDEPIRVRIGLHTGEAIKEGEDFFGRSVILAARIASQAHGEQILVSSLLKALVEGSTDVEFGEAREVELKGLSGAHQLFDIHWRREG